MNYFGTVINSSSTIAEKAGADILEGQLLALKYNDLGEVVVCDTEGENVAGILMPDCSNVITKVMMLAFKLKILEWLNLEILLKKAMNSWLMQQVNLYQLQQVSL